jgi:hypothetical protein
VTTFRTATGEGFCDGCPPWWWACVVLSACATPAILKPKTNPEVIYAQPCPAGDGGDIAPADAGPFGEFLVVVPPPPHEEFTSTNNPNAGALCCPKGFVPGGMSQREHLVPDDLAQTDCPRWQC